MFQPRRRLGKLLMIISVVFFGAALYTLFFYTAPYFGGSSMRMPETERQQYTQPQFAEGAALPSAALYTWPYRWLSQPLAIIGIVLLLTGLLIGYYDDLSQLF